MFSRFKESTGMHNAHMPLPPCPLQGHPQMVELLLELGATATDLSAPPNKVGRGCPHCGWKLCSRAHSIPVPLTT